VITGHFQQALGQQNTTRGHVHLHILQNGPTLTVAQQVGLITPFTDKEIKDAIWSIPSIKSPGPDGFNTCFYKTCWLVLGTQVCLSIKEFFSTGIPPEELNTTRIVLIPKIQSLKTAFDFKPIACYNLIYKTISKVLCSRLRKVLPNVINHSRAFVDRRELLFNVLLCQEIARGYNRRKITSRCMMKIDLKKAYDSVHWDCVREILDGLQFPPIFIKWIMACITTTTFTIQVNGSDHGKFKGGRGLR